MKNWSNYIKNEWIILIPIILASVFINEYSDNLFWNNLSYWIGNISFYLLLTLVIIRTVIAIRNAIKGNKK